ncbi:MAG: hypothetical protein SFU91_02685 [Chloroherpetonaceae bacterium]|nr:hypothetical protein [Chloroherpetonaceae bacterium]
MSEKETQTKGQISEDSETVPDIRIGERIRARRNRPKSFLSRITVNEIIGYSLSLTFFVLAVAVFIGKGMPSGSSRQFQNMMTGIFLLYSIYRFVVTRAKAAQKRRIDSINDHRRKLGEESPDDRDE